jgi:hypothetical protein
MKCCFCPEPVEQARERAGLSCCKACGDAAAKFDLAYKHSQVGPAYNKGSLQFLGGDQFRSNALDAGRKTSAVVSDDIPDATPAKRTAPAARRRRVGTMWTADGDCFVLYAGDDPKKRGAVRFVLSQET